jgi:hypothetical protein
MKKEIVEMKNFYVKNKKVAGVKRGYLRSKLTFLQLRVKKLKLFSTKPRPQQLKEKIIKLK